MTLASRILKNLYLFLTLLISSFVGAVEVGSSLETDEIYWNTSTYRSIPDSEKKQYVYHRRLDNFIGNQIIPLNRMPELDGFAAVYEKAIAKYKGREKTLTCVIPSLNCLWNDVIFLSPVHPHKHYEEYRKIGYAEKPKLQFYKIPIEVLKDKRVTVWKWLSYKKYPKNHPIHDSLESYCSLDFLHFTEMQDLPEDTKEHFRNSFDPKHPEIYPKYNWYRIPHILCQDPIDLTDERITLIEWSDPIED